MPDLQLLLGFLFNFSTATYEKIDLIKPENHDLLLADLRERTGLAVTRCEIGRIDFVRDVAEIQIHYLQDPAQSRGIERARTPGRTDSI